MANLILTSNCNINCPFCFAAENVQCLSNDTHKEFSAADVWKTISFLNCQDNTVRLCGGEPSLNKDIVNIIECLLYNDYKLLLMTNGLWPQTFFNYIQNLNLNAVSRIKYLFNVLEPSFYNPNQLETLNKTLRVVNPVLTTLGITIYQNNFNFSYILDLAIKYGFKNIRVSIAAPNITIDNNSINVDNHLIAKRLHEFLLEAKKNNINLIKDCNFIQPCFFETEQLLDFKLGTSNNWSFSCNSSVIDIDCQNNAWRCYGLYSILKVNIKNFPNEEHLKNFFDRRIDLLSTNMPCFSECSTCKYWKKGCSGGCYADRIKRAIKENPNLILFPIDDNNEILQCKPFIKETTVISNSTTNKLIYYKSGVINPDDNTIGFLSEIDGHKSIKYLIDLWSPYFDNYEQAKTEVISMCRNLFEKDIIGINYSYPVRLHKRPESLAITHNELK